MQRRILVVDDEADMVSMIKMRLEANKFGDTNSIFKGEDLHVKDYIIKPCDSGVLLETIGRFI